MLALAPENHIYISNNGIFVIKVLNPNVTE